MDFKWMLYIFFVVMCIGLVAVSAVVYTINPADDCVYYNVTEKIFVPAHTVKTEFIAYGVIWPISSEKKDAYFLYVNNSHRIEVNETVYKTTRTGVNKFCKNDI